MNGWFAVRPVNGWFAAVRPVNEWLVTVRPECGKLQVSKGCNEVSWLVVVRSVNEWLVTNRTVNCFECGQ